MTKIEELHLIIELLKKHNLPISPILEYSIQERESQYVEDCGTSIVNEPVIYTCEKGYEEYKWDLTHLSVRRSGGKELPHKAILLLALIRQIESNTMVNNEIPLNNVLAKIFTVQWNELIPNDKSPSVWTPFWYMKTEPFWHFQSTNDEKSLTWLLSFGGQPSIGQMRPVIKYAYLDEELFYLLQEEHNRNALKEILINRYIIPYTK